MRVAAYALASSAAALVAVFKAYLERPNFYSSSVAIAQSNASIMVLLNEGFVAFYFAVWTLIRVVWGQLRPIEYEAITERAWASIIETMIAMAIFRDDIGVWFMVMFCSLLAGRVWEWIAQMKVEYLEQQNNPPRFYHTRLACGLLAGVFFSLEMLKYSINTVLDDPRPSVMVMFAFEFALLSLSSVSQMLRYVITAVDIFKTRSQITSRIRQAEDRARAERAAARQAEQDSGTAIEAQPSQELIEITENDIDTDVPGWEEKGRYLFVLDLVTDFIRLILFLTFFAVLVTFHGLPIHILRDMYMTINSFFKRLSDYFKYANATKDMNARYPDATAEDLERDNTCIVCRENMRPWDPDAPERNERLRAKKLPCGHILHFHCLRSWLERQQVCPTCRAPVLTPANNPNRQGNGQQGDQAAAVNANPRPARNLRHWNVNIGPVRMHFAAGRLQARNEQRPQAQGGQAAQQPQPPNQTPRERMQESMRRVQAQTNVIAQRAQMARPPGSLPPPGLLAQDPNTPQPEAYQPSPNVLTYDQREYLFNRLELDTRAALVREQQLLDRVLSSRNSIPGPPVSRPWNIPGLEELSVAAPHGYTLHPIGGPVDAGPSEIAGASVPVVAQFSPPANPDHLPPPDTNDNRRPGPSATVEDAPDEDER